MRTKTVLTFIFGLAPWACAHGADDGALSHDRRYCEFFLTGKYSQPHFSHYFQPEAVVGKLIELQQDERKLLDYENGPLEKRVQLLSELSWVHIHEFVKTNADKPQRLNLKNIFEFYLRKVWDENSVFYKNQAPYFYQEYGAEVRFSDFRRGEMEKLSRVFSLRINLAKVMTLVDSWLPAAPASRLAAFRAVDQNVDDPALSSFLIGSDSFYWRNEELGAGDVGENQLVGPGARESKITTRLYALARLWKMLDFKPGQTLVDLGAGDGRIGVSLHAYATSVKYLGVEVFEPRVRRARQTAETLRLPAETFQVLQGDLASPDAKIPEGDFYFMFNSFPPGTLRRVLSSLEAMAATRSFKIVMYNMSLFKGDNPDFVLDQFLPPQPSWLELDGVYKIPVAKRVAGPWRANYKFFVYKTKPL